MVSETASCELERENGDNVKEEPSFEVGVGDAPVAGDKDLVTVVVSCNESEHHIDEEDTVSEAFEHAPPNRAVLVEGDMNGSKDR